jgi:hypothetical protein
VATEEEGEEPKQVKQEGDHRAEIVAGSGPADQLLGLRPRFWRRTGTRRPGPPWPTCSVSSGSTGWYTTLRARALGTLMKETPP